MASKAIPQAFQWDDPLSLDGQISDDERAVRDLAHAYCQEQLLPQVQGAFRYEKTDVGVFRGMGELGLLGATIPEAYGGAALNYVCYGLIAREVERVDSGYRSMIAVGVFLGAPTPRQPKADVPAFALRSERHRGASARRRNCEASSPPTSVHQLRLHTLWAPAVAIITAGPSRHPCTTLAAIVNIE